MVVWRITEVIVLSLTRKADYALVAMSHMAHRGQQRTSAREIAERVHVPLPMLTNILHQLSHEGLITSSMGSKGGYRLARGPEAISLADILDAIEGQFRLTMCCSEEAGGCSDIAGSSPVGRGAALAGDAQGSLEPPDGEAAVPADRCDLERDCMIKEPVRRVNRSFRQFLSQVSLAQIAFDRVPVNLAIDSRSPDVSLGGRVDQPAAGAAKLA